MRAVRWKISNNTHPVPVLNNTHPFPSKCSVDALCRVRESAAFATQRSRVRIPPGPPRKKPLLSTKTREVFSCFQGQNSPQYSKKDSKQGLERSIRPCWPLFFCISAVRLACYFLRFFAQQRSWQNSTRRDLNTEKHRDVAEK